MSFDAVIVEQHSVLYNRRRELHRKLFHTTDGTDAERLGWLEEFNSTADEADSLARMITLAAASAETNLNG